MKLSEYFDKLKPFAEKYPDVEVVYAKDEEGNAFEPVCYNPSVGYYNDNSFTSENEEGETVNSVCLN